jgi:DNA repair photolyase
MRWDSLRADKSDSRNQRTPALFGEVVATRTFDTPQFRGLTFHEVRARSIINRVPDASRMPFRWTINPYRGCSHACVYCFARNTHTYLDLDAGKDFDTQIVVKVNAAELLRKELTRTSWHGEHIAMGTNVDPYQRAEGRYRLMSGIIEALRDAANPFSILTKGTLILRDLDLLREAAQVTSVGASFSIGFLDLEMWRSVEPGTPSPRARLDACRKLTDSGIECGVLMAPILPFLTDSPEALESCVKAIAAVGATRVSPIVLHLRPGAREWFFRWLRQEHPQLVARYEALYHNRSYAPAPFQRRISDLVHELARAHGMNLAGRPVAAPSRVGTYGQLALL